MTETQPVRSRRVRPALRVFAIVAFVVLLPIAAHSAWDYIEVRRLVREIERIQEKGEAVTETAALGPAPSALDAAASYYLAAALLALDTTPYEAVRPVREWFAARRPDLAALQPLLEPVRRVAGQHVDALALADKASRLEFTRFPAGTEFSYRAAGLGGVSQLIAARAIALAAAGDGDAAVESLVSGLRLRRASHDARWGIAAQDDTALVLSVSRPSSESLRVLAEALAADEVGDRSHRRLLRERATYLDRIWRRYYGSEPSAPRSYTLPMRSVYEWIVRPWITHDVVDGLRAWAEFVEAAKVPWPDRARVSRAVEERYRQEYASAPTRPTYINGIVMGNVAFGSFRLAMDPTAMIIDRCTRVAVAIERFKRDRGEAPLELAALVPEYLPELPSDPYSGQPLTFLTTADAYTIYSVGANRKDDGGDLTSELEDAIAKGFGGRRIRGADVGVRVLTTLRAN